MIILSGSYFANLSAIEQQKLIVYLHLIWGIEPNRLDIAIDDYTFKAIPLKQMIKAYQEGNHFGFQEYQQYPNTHYFGSRNKSRKLVRVYQRSDCLRYEAQFRYHHAKSVFREIAHLGLTRRHDENWSREIQRTLGNLAIGAIDFRDKSKGSTSKARTKRLPFWQKFINKVNS